MQGGIRSDIIRYTTSTTPSGAKNHKQGNYLKMMIKGLILMATLCILNPAVVHADETSKKCECAAFNVAGEKVPEGVAPILVQNPLNVTCTAEDAITCELLCIELVKVGKEKAPEIICNELKHTGGLQPSLWSRTCGGAWKYSGLTCEKKICCHEGKSVPCE